MNRFKGIPPESQPLISVVIVVYNMQRAAAHTLESFTSAYQNVSPDLYEVIVVENGSSEPLSRESVEACGPNFRYFALENAAPSPVPALNFGVQQARGRMVGMMIDGARIVTPGVLQYALRALSAYSNPVVALLGWYLGRHSSRQIADERYSEEVEDALLRQIEWQKNGYRLFESSTLVASNPDGYFGAISESNCLFVLRSTYIAMGGFDERFDAPGGGVANLDFYYRLSDDPTVELVILLGEGNFHQLHGGITTNCEDETVLHSRLAEWMDQYRAIHGKPYQLPTRIPEFWGHLPSESASFMQISARRYLGLGPEPSYAETKLLRQQLETGQRAQQRLAQIERTRGWRALSLWWHLKQSLLSVLRR